MTSGIKKAALGFLYQAGAAAFFRRLHRREVTILTFHGFTDRKHSGTENADGKHLHVATFDALLAWLVKRCNVVTMEAAIRYLNGEGTLPENPVVLTFDDGYRSNLKLALPVLRKHKAPAVVFIATSFVEQQRALWHDRMEFAFGTTQAERLCVTIGGREITAPLQGEAQRKAAMKLTKSALKKLPQEQLLGEVARVEELLGARLEQLATAPAIYQALNGPEMAELSASGLVSFGCHTHNHLILGRCQPDTITTELQTCRSLLERRLETACPAFCYPNGGPGDFSADSEACLKKLNFTCGLTTIEGYNPKGANVFALKRFSISNAWSADYAALVVSGFLPFVWQLRGQRA